MQKFALITFLISFVLIMGCTSQNTLTDQEMQIQNTADIAVSELLFDAGLDTKASYNVHKDGHVEIEFTADVGIYDYTQVVEKLRQDHRIKSVFAVQSGNEVCPLK